MAKNVTMRDIAKEANVSVAAVSMALRGHPSVSASTRRRISDISENLRYKPIRRRTQAKEASNSPRCIALIVNESLQRDTITEMLSVAAMAGNARDISIEVLTIPDDPDDDQPLSLKGADRFDGLLIAGHVSPAVEAHLAKLSAPWVSLGHATGSRQVSCRSVAVDLIGAACWATQQLLKLSRAQVGFFCGPATPGLWNDMWLSGYRLAHAIEGVALDPELVLTDLPVPLHEVGTCAAQMMASKEQRPTTYLTPTIYAAMRFQLQMQSLGCPIDKQHIASGGSLEQARDCHGESLPLVAIDPRKTAEVAFAALIEAMDQPDLPINARVLPVEFINFPNTDDVPVESPGSEV